MRMRDQTLTVPVLFLAALAAVGCGAKAPLDTPPAATVPANNGSTPGTETLPTSGSTDAGTHTPTGTGVTCTLSLAGIQCSNSSSYTFGQFTCANACVLNNTTGGVTCTSGANVCTFSQANGAVNCNGGMCSADQAGANYTCSGACTIDPTTGNLACTAAANTCNWSVENNISCNGGTCTQAADTMTGGCTASRTGITCANLGSATSQCVFDNSGFTCTTGSCLLSADGKSLICTGGCVQDQNTGVLTCLL